MTPRPKATNPKANLIAVRVSDETLSQMRALQERDGTPLSEQVRRALAVWLDTKGVTSPRRKRL